MKLVLLILTVVLLIVPAQNLFADDFELPEIHADVSIQSVFYIDEDEQIPFLSSSSDKIEIRHAAIEAEGELGEYIEYNIEVGLSTCTGGGCTTSGSLALSEAGIFYKPYRFLKLGFFQGHIMRGFELHQECTEVLTAEKPRFKSIFPCHPIGAVVQSNYMFDDNMGFDAQLTFNAGNSGNSTIEDEHDINLGLKFHTPYPGLSVGGFVTGWQWKVSEYDPEIADFRAFSYDGTRLGMGIDYANYGVIFRSEFYFINGYIDTNPIREYTASGDTLTDEDLESRAFYVQGGYQFDTGNDRLPYIRPFAMYQSWDKASNADGDNKLSYLAIGAAIGLGSDKAELKIDYEMPLDSPDGTFDEAKRLIVRLTGGF